FGSFVTSKACSASQIFCHLGSMTFGSYSSMRSSGTKKPLGQRGSGSYRGSRRAAPRTTPEAVALHRGEPSNVAGKPSESPFRIGGALPVEVLGDGAAVRLRDALRVVGEPFPAERLPVLRVGPGHVVATDRPRGGEEGEADAARHLEQRPVLLVG